MDQRAAFIADWLEDEWTMTEAAERYQSSRKTAYKWVDRYAGSAAGLADRSRAPQTHGGAMARRIREAILALRAASPLGAEGAGGALAGAAAAREVAGGKHDGGPVAARRTQPAAAAHPLRGAIDLAIGRRACPERCLDRGFQGLVPDGGSDAVRSADGGGRLQSLRVLLSDRGPTERGVRPWFERAFREYGLPRAMRTDNGSPFATPGAGHLSRLAVWPGRNRVWRLARLLHAAGTERQLWKCRPRGNPRTVPTGTWKSRTDRGISTDKMNRLVS
jgi:hypothetical protein